MTNKQDDIKTIYTADPFSIGLYDEMNWEYSFWDNFTAMEDLAGGTGGVSIYFEMSVLPELKTYNWKQLAELALASNWKIWQHYKTNNDLGCLYNEIWRFVDGFAYDTLKGEALSNYFQYTD